jgi:hypothetical protein
MTLESSAELMARLDVENATPNEQKVLKEDAM